MANENNFYVSLNDARVRLDPLTAGHIQEMRKLSGDADIWTWYTADLSSPDALEAWMNARLKEAEAGQKLSYAVVSQETNEVIGSTSFGHIDWKEKAMEIGWTWLGKAYIGTGINKHMKFLMLQHAFEIIKTERIELRTDERNLRSRKAMEKIGAQHDGTLRNHRSTRDGRRNTVIYSIIKSEWPEVKAEIFKGF